MKICDDGDNYVHNNSYVHNNYYVHNNGYDYNVHPLPFLRPPIKQRARGVDQYPPPPLSDNASRSSYIIPDPGLDQGRVMLQLIIIVIRQQVKKRLGGRGGRKGASGIHYRKYGVDNND